MQKLVYMMYVLMIMSTDGASSNEKHKNKNLAINDNIKYRKQ
jgi:hypothetical protein